MIYTEMHVCAMYMYIMLIHGGVYVYSTYTQWCVHRNFQSSNAQDRTTQYKTVGYGSYVFWVTQVLATQTTSGPHLCRKVSSQGFGVDNARIV